MRERVPLATVQDAVLQFLRGRDDAALFGAQAVNADQVRKPKNRHLVDVLGAAFGRNQAIRILNRRKQRKQRWCVSSVASVTSC